MGAALEVVKRGLIGIDVAAAGAAFDRHVAEGHALLHREGFDRRPGEFIGVAHTAFYAKGADDVQHQIFGKDAGLQRSIHPDAPHLELVHRQALAGQDIAHLAGANAKGNGTKGAVGGSVRITAGHGHARLSQAQLRGHHMHDSLAATAKAIEMDAVLMAVALQGAEHFFGQSIGEGPRLARGWHDVVHRGHRAFGVADTQPQILQGSKGLRTGDLMDQVQANEQLRRPAGQLSHLMQGPDLVVEGGCAQALLPSPNRAA